MMLPKLVIFDMDGTVLNTLEDLLAAMNHALTKRGMPPHTLKEMQSFVGNGLYMMAVRAVPEGTSKEDVDAVFRDFKAYYSEHLNVYTKPYDGIREVLAALKERGIATAISSNKYDAGAKLLAQCHFGALVDMTVGESELTPKKPDPAGTLAIMRALGGTPENTMYFGDSGVDIETAKNAGLTCVCVSWGFRSPKQLLEAGAETVVTGPAEMLSYILER